MIVSHTLKLPVPLAEQLDRVFAEVKKEAIATLERAHKDLKKAVAAGSDVTVRNEAEAAVIRARDNERLTTLPNFMRWLLEVGVERARSDTFAPFFAHIQLHGLVQGRQTLTEESKKAKNDAMLMSMHRGQQAHKRKANG